MIYYLREKPAKTDLFMQNTFYFQDTYFPFSYIDHVRIVVRAVVINENNEAIINHVFAKDLIGQRNCFELPGGGKNKNETLRQGVLREILEETGYECEIIKYLGKVIDYYNIIHRENHNYFYLLKAKRFVGKKLEDYEKEVIDECCFKPIDLIIEGMKNVHDDGVGHIVAQREIPILQLAQEYLRRKEK